MGLALATVIAGCLAGCTLTNTGAPAISGPSELGLALTLQATPEVITQDGTSQSMVTVVARDAYARPIAALAVRADIAVQGVLQDFGRLSGRNVTTASDGRASLAYIAPEPVAGITAQTTITIVVTPLTGDARSQVPRTVDIRLVPPVLP
jgi:hypothetical protein